MTGFSDFPLYFPAENRGLGPRPWTTSGPGPWWTGHGWWHQAHRSLASSRSGAQGHQPRGGRGGVGDGEPDCPLNGAWEAVRWPGDGGEVAAVRTLVRGMLGIIDWEIWVGMSAVRRGELLSLL
jgi:hypothetical protein